MPLELADLEKADLSKNPVLIAIMKSIKGLGNLVIETGKQVKELGERQTQFQTSVQEQLTKGVKKAKKPADDDDGAGDEGGDDDDGDLSDDDVNSMSQADLFRLIVKETGKVVEKHTKPLKGEVDSVKKAVVSKSSNDEVNKFLDKNPQLVEWKDEIAEISKENPKLSIARLYNLARAENPKKAKELDNKYKNAKVVTDDAGNTSIDLGGGGGNDDGDDADITKFFGLPPGGGKTKPEKTEKMTPQQAAEDAWSKTMAKLPAALRGDD